VATTPVTLDFDKAVPISGPEPSPVPTQAQALQGAVSYASQQDPVRYAKLLQLQQLTGIPPSVTQGNEHQVQQAANQNRIDPRYLTEIAPITSGWASDPHNAAVSGVDEIHRLAGIEQHAAVMRAYTPTFWDKLSQTFADVTGRTPDQVKQRAYDFPLTRGAIDVVGGTAGIVGNVASFFGLHGDGPTKQNFLQRIETGLSAETNTDPSALFHKSNEFDWLMKNVAPMVPSVVTSGGTSLLAKTLGLSDKAAKVLTGLTIGGMFTADQAGKTYTAVAGAGGSDDAARLAANRVAAITVLPNAMFGATDLIPALRNNPLLTSIGLGSATGVSGQIAQNVVTGKPTLEGVPSAAVQGAAMQGGMHLGTDAFFGSLTQAVAAADESQLRTRSPEKFHEALQTIFAGDESLRIPAEQFNEYFKGKEMDPAEVAGDIGASNYAEAVLSGGDVEVPKADFLSKLDPEHQKGLLADVVDPATGLTMRQHQEGREELQKWVAEGGPEKLQAETAEADAETASSPEWQSVKEDLRQRYVDAGETPEVAETLAVKDANAYSNLAKSAGLKPSELVNYYNPKVVAEESPGAGAQALHQEAIEKIRTVIEAAKQPGHVPHKAVIAPVGAWLVEAAREHGYDLDGYTHIIDGSAIRHTLNSHGNAKTEAQRGQIAVTERDFESIPEIISDPDYLILNTKNRLGRDQIGYAKKMPDGSVLYVEEVRAGKKRGGAKELAAVTMRRFPATMDADRIAVNLHPNARGDGRDPIVVRNPTAGKNNDFMLQSASAPGTPRGWFRVLPDGTYEIGRTKIGDLSTFVHEPAHAYLHIISELATREGASETIKGDYAKILDYLGAKEGQPLTREQHETWARANEQYLREGKAPSEGLKGVFQRFAIWLGTVYKKASDLGVELNDNIRGVFDRLYAAEGGVDRAVQEGGPQLFSSPEEAGWTEEEFQKYAEARGLEVEHAKAEILAKLNDAAVRERTDAWREEEKNAREALTQQIDRMPEYQAIRSLRRGALDDGTALTLRREELVKQFGEERVKDLQRLHPGLYRNEGGVDTEAAAEVLGFNSAEDMLSALEAVPRRTDAIDTSVREHMTNKYGDIRYDGSLNDQARMAVENQNRAENLHRELKALQKKIESLKGKAADQKSALRSIQVAPIESYREAAQQMVESKAIADLQPTRYLDASRKYSREAFDALRKGKIDEAAQAKHKELLNHFLFREATKAKEYIGKFESYVKRMQTKTVQQKLGLAGADYRDQFNRLLSRYGLAAAPAEPPARTLAEWASALYDEGKESAIDPQMFDETRAVHYRHASVAEIRMLHDALTNIRHLASQELGMEVNGRKIEFNAAVERMAAQARESIKSKPRPVLDENRTTEQKAGDLVNRGTALLARTEFLMKRLDGGTSGPWHDYLWNLAADAQGKEAALQAEVTKRVGDALEKMPKEQRLKLLEKVTIDGITEPVTRRTLLAMAFNMGNEGNLDRLQKTFVAHGWDPAAIEKVKGMLTREEWQFVQDGWDSLKPLGAAQAELEKRLTGLPPVMVKPEPFSVELADGSTMDIAGGYYPVVMDPRFSKRGAQQDAGQTAQNMMESGYGRAATSRGNMKERTGFGGPLQLDYEQVLTQHTAKVIKDITHREFMLTANKLLLDPAIRQTLRETLGVGNEKQMMPWLRTIINDRNGSTVQGLGDVSRAMNTLRTNVVKAALGFKFSTMLLQLTHASSIFLHTSPASYAQAMIDFVAHPFEMSEQIRNLSPNEMATRGENLDRDMRKVLQDGTRNKTVADVWAKAGWAPIQFMDHMLSFPMWLAVYRNALAENVHLSETEAKYQAMHKADGAVRMGLGSNAPKDLAPIMRNNDVTKLLTTMGGFHNLKWNQIADVSSEFGKSRKVGQLTYGMIMAAIIPAIMGPLLTGRGPEDDENKGTWAAKRALLFPAETMAIMNIGVEALENKGDVRFSPVVSMIERGAKAVVHATSDAEIKDRVGIGLDTLQAAMEAYGVPGTDQIFKTLRYTRKSQQGKIEHPNVWGAVAGASH